jgi:hypothetical protein
VILRDTEMFCCLGNASSLFLEYPSNLRPVELLDVHLPRLRVGATQGSPDGRFPDLESLGDLTDTQLLVFVQLCNFVV